MDTEAALHTLYRDLLEAWNRRDAQAFAALFRADGQMVGYDGSQVAGSAIVAHLAPIFADHPTARYVAKVREVRPLGSQAALLRAVVGMVPPGQASVDPERNAVQSLVAQEDGDTWRIVLFQNTPAQYHGRPELTDQHTAEVQQVLDSSG
jgi:uncharacterized protein (TIGR02246 family)